MSAPADLPAAEARAALARERLNGTVEALQSQLTPEALVATARAEAKRGGRKAATAAIKHPLAIAGAAALLVGFLVRKPVARAGKRLITGRPAKPPRDAGVPDENAALPALNERIDT